MPNTKRTKGQEESHIQYTASTRWKVIRTQNSSPRNRLRNPMTRKGLQKI